MPCAAIDHGDQQWQRTSGSGGRGGATAEMAVDAGALGMRDEQGEPHRCGGVPCATLGWGDQQATDHRDGEVAVNTLSHGEPTPKDCLASLLAGEAIRRNFVLVAGGLSGAGPLMLGCCAGGLGDQPQGHHVKDHVHHKEGSRGE